MAMTSTEKARRYREKYPDRVREQRKAYRAANREKILAAEAKYRAANPEKLLAAAAKWYAANREKRAAYRAANREKRAAYHAAWYAANREERRVAVAKYRAANPERFIANQRQKRGLPLPTRPEPDICECCNLPQRGKRLALDHCHVSGAFRGWLCGGCNTAIGKLGDSIDGLMNAVRYLQRAAEVKT